MEKKIKELSFHLEILDKALVTLEEVLEEEYSIIVRDATIQRFEYTFELTWKMFQKIAKIEGTTTGSPRQAIRSAFDVGLLTSVDDWFEMLDARNRSTHTYNAITADVVYRSARMLPGCLRPILVSTKKNYID